jgi:uncharacterized protein (UPF0332 family)
MNKSGKQELIEYRISRAKETLKEVEVQIENELWYAAVNRLYYACFYAVISLLTQYDIKTKTHSGVRQMFGLHFVKPGIINERSGEFYTEIFDLRHTGDYEDFIVFEKDKVLALIAPAHKLIEEIELLLSKQ